MNVIKVCDNNAYENGCIPNYKGRDTILKEQGASDEIVETAQKSCTGFTENNIKKASAFITQDGMIFFPYAVGMSYAPLIIVDVNGFKGPNKWGHDVYSLKLTLNTDFTGSVAKSCYGGCYNTVEKGGITSYELIYEQ